MKSSDVLGWIRENLTEERTDKALDLAVQKFGRRLPWWIPSGVARAVLDALFPELLFYVLGAALPADAEGVA